MSKRDIKAKRWARNKPAAAPEKTASPFGEEPLQFLTQVRMLGDGSWQYREHVLLRRFSLKLRRKGFAGLEWHDC